MAWFCAHAIFYYELKYKQQDSYLIDESVFLIQAENGDATKLIAEKIARNQVEVLNSYDTDSQDSQFLNDEPCRLRFAGIRKVISVSYIADKKGQDDIPAHGAEVTYSMFEVDTLEEVKKLANDEFVEVLYRE
jgi:hypothetical protein